MTTIRSKMQFVKTDFIPVAAVAVAGIALAIFVFLLARAYYSGIARQQFQRNVAYYGATFKSEVDRHVTSLAAIHAFVSTSHQVNRWEFSAFAHQILPENSGFKAVLWLPAVPRTDRAAFEARLQNDGLFGLHLRELLANGQLVNADTRAVYLPVAYVEPFDGNGSLIGVDLLNNPIYAPLFHTARQSHRAAASAPIAQALVEGAKQPIVIVAFPLIQEAPLAQTTAIRDSHSRVHHPAAPSVPGLEQAAPQGFVLGVLQLNQLIEDAIGEFAPIDAAIAYGPQGAPSVFASDKKDRTTPLNSWFKTAAFHQRVPFQVAGRHFFLVMRSTTHGDIQTSLYIPAGAALLVFALTALLVQNMVTTALRKHLVELAVVARTAELRDLNSVLHEEVGQRRQAEAALRIEKDKAENANRAKSVFLSTMSHELRTPLNAIIGFSGILLQDTRVPDEKAKDYSREINASGTKLLDLINDILEITQMDTEGTLAGESVFLPEILHAVVEKMQPLADIAGVVLQVRASDTMPMLLGDSKRMHKMVAHLVSNAIKFTGHNGSAKVAAYHDASGVVIEVSDTGVGMAPEAEARVAALFSQNDGALSRRYEGMGLGLAFVRRVADQHGAALRINSRQGHGTSVCVVFPISRVAQRSLDMREIA